MKRIITLFVLLTTTFLCAQNSGITYQAVLYNPSAEILPGNNNTNAVLSNKDICLRFSITDAQTSLEYQETQKVKTDEFGMVNLLVGSGSQVGGYATNFNTIIWNSSSKKLQVEIDVTGTCANFIEVSNQNFSAVPFAYASKTAENVSGIVPITNGGTGATTVAGAKTNLGLNNIDNTSDANKPISTATQTALNGKEDKLNKSTTTILGTSDVLYPTQNAVKVYVDNQISNVTIPVATVTIKGKLQLAGDLGGTADAPTVPGLANKENSANKSNDINLGNSDVFFPTQKAVKTYVDNQIGSGVADADLTTKGKIQLAGDLGGTATSPTVPGLALKEPTISAGTTSQYFRGDKTWQTLDKSAVGLVNVDNTSDANKPVSTATQTALNGKEDTTNKSTTTTLGTSDILFPTQNAVKTYVDTQIITNATPNATTVSLGKIQLGGDLAGTNSTALVPVITDGAINTAKIANNAVTNAKIGEIVSVNKGGTGADMSNAGAGYVKQANNGANFTTVSTIPVADVDGAVRKVNGVSPATDGNVSVLIGRVFTGNTLDPNTSSTVIGATPAKHQSDIYVVSETGNINNGRTFIYDGASWIEVASNFSTSDARYVNVAGDTMEGDLTVPTGNKLIVTDAPTNATDAANKDYVDTKIGGTGITNYVPKFSASKTLTDSSIFDNGIDVGIGTITPTSKLETVGDIKSRNSGNTNSIVLNTSLASLDITSNSRMFRVGSFSGTPFRSQIDGTIYFAGVGGISQLSLNTPGEQPITFATNDWIERMRIQNTTGFVGIGTTTPSNKLEITQGTAGNSGLRFTNLNATSTASTSSSKVLSLNSSGDVILTNVPGTQNIVSFSTATPTTTGVVFTPNTSSDSSVIYQSAFDNSMWTYNGTTYVTYTPPASTAWYTSGTTNDAGSSKTSNIYRTGNVGIGSSTPSSPLVVQGTPGAGVLKLTSSLPTATGDNWWLGFGHGTNSTDANDRARLGVDIVAGGSGRLFFTTGAPNAQTRAMFINESQNVGIGTSTPLTKLHIQGATAIQTPNASESLLRLSRPSQGGVKWDNIAQFNLGTHYDSGNAMDAKSRLDLALTNGADAATFTTTMTWLGNGNVGVGTSAPSGTLEIATSNGLSSIIKRFGNTSLAAANLILQKTYGTTATTHGAGIANGDYVGRILFSASNGSSYLTNGTDIVGYAAGTQSSTNNGGGIFFRTVPQNSVSQSLERMRIDENGNIGIGITTPAAQLHTTGSVLFAGAGTPGAGKVLTSDASGNATWQPGTAPISIATKTSDFTISSTDNGNVIVVNSATTVIVTVPATLSAGFSCQIIQQGDGQVQVSAGSGVTISSALGLYSRTKGSSIGIMMSSSTNGFISGDSAF